MRSAHGDTVIGAHPPSSRRLAAGRPAPPDPRQHQHVGKQLSQLSTVNCPRPTVNCRIFKWYLECGTRAMFALSPVAAGTSERDASANGATSERQPQMKG
ncbi:hypothetical protein JI435_428300 [Parastagonospora nodorum SN15]|nr:hypothetical protein JI435_428300 [Parastagonospora nodorum SN15]